MELDWSNASEKEKEGESVCEGKQNINTNPRTHTADEHEATHSQNLDKSLRKHNPGLYFR